MYNYNITGFEIISLRIVLEVYIEHPGCVYIYAYVASGAIVLYLCRTLVPILKSCSLYDLTVIVIITDNIILFFKTLWLIVCRRTQSREFYYWHIPIVCCRLFWRRFLRVRIDWHRIWVSTFCCRHPLGSTANWCFQPNR